MKLVAVIVLFVKFVSAANIHHKSPQLDRPAEVAKNVEFVLA